MDDLDTPVVLVDHGRMLSNIARMHEQLCARGVVVRPHVKTHKIPQIARLQRDAGARGITVATIGEAEVFADHGFDDIFIAYPLWITARAAVRLRAISARAKVMFGVDSAEGIAAAAAHLASAARDVSVMIEVDSGHHRSGVRPADVGSIASAARSRGLDVAGVFTFPGHSYAPGHAEEAARQEREALAEAARSLADAGWVDVWISGGSTPSVLATPAGAVSELRPGVYVFGDAQQVELGHHALDEVALTVLSTVVSRSEDGDQRRVILDAGSKILGSDRPAYVSGFGRILEHPAARIAALSEHHATVVFPDDVALPELGSRLRVIPNHVCLVPNLVDEVVVVRDGAVGERWPVAARGRNG